MRLGIALDLHAPAQERGEVGWEQLRQQTLVAEAAGLDLVVVPDHLYYSPGGDNGYARRDVPVGAWESVAVVAALAAATSRIDIGHSMLNAPYRNAAITANIAVTLDEISGGRYSLGIGSGNSYDYDELGVDTSDRHQRFAESLTIISGMLAGETVDVNGTHAKASSAELVLRHRDAGPPLIVAANGPRSRRLAVRHGAGWNLWAGIDEQHDAVASAITDTHTACEELGRDAQTLITTIDTPVDALDLHGQRERSLRSLARLGELGADEVRCYVANDGTHASRMAGLEALAEISDRS